MTRQRRGWWGAGLAVVVGALAALGRAAGQADAPAPGAPAGPEQARRDAVAAQYRGVGKCAAVACHGGPLPAEGEPPSRKEHTIWIGRDRHAEAYSTLTTPWSKAIARRLGGGDAERNPRCLACHETLPLGAAVVQGDGVSCESCHGAAGRWLEPHIRDAWDGYSPKKKERLGMTDLRSVVRRAEVCAGCHVGGPGREVNHDLIAAGHPRLDFEFSAFLAKMPAHWDRTTKAPDNLPDFPARCWSVGQAVSARAALELLRDRAERAEKAKAPWPEFSEFGCFSCHHDLLDESWRRHRERSGLPEWGTWHFDASASWAADVATLRGLMNEPGAEPQKVADASGAAVNDLARWLQAHGDDSFNADEVARRIHALNAPATVSGWDQAARRYLELVPLHQALDRLAPEGHAADWVKDLEGLRDSLKFPKDYDSPRGFDPKGLPKS